MAQTVSNYGMRYLSDAPGLRQALQVPLLVWALPSESDSQELILRTAALSEGHRPRAGEPIVFELRKDPGKTNPFAMGVTVGRNDNNDIVLDHPSISRFHAYFQLDPRSKDWKLVDAESRNGTWCGPMKLMANQAQPLADHAKLRFGELDLTFYLPASFLTFLEQQLK